MRPALRGQRRVKSLQVFQGKHRASHYVLGFPYSLLCPSSQEPTSAGAGVVPALNSAPSSRSTRCGVEAG